MLISHNVEIADMLTDSATLPPAKEAKKLDMSPPGQAATNNIPNATLG